MPSPEPLEIFEQRTRTPDIEMEDDYVASTEFEYSTRAPNDWVLSGPLPEGGGPGRRFSSWEEAEEWVKGKHPNRVKGAVTEAGLGNRWAFLIKGT